MKQELWFVHLQGMYTQTFVLNLHQSLQTFYMTALYSALVYFLNYWDTNLESWKAIESSIMFIIVIFHKESKKINRVWDEMLDQLRFTSLIYYLGLITAALRRLLKWIM